MRCAAISLLFCLFFFASCTAHPPVKVYGNDTHLVYMGRVNQTDSATILSWPGSSVAIRFTGSEVAVRLKDETGNNYYYAVIDSGNPVKLRPDTTNRLYPLATHLRQGSHTALLYKLTESRAGKTWFYGFELEHSARILAPKNPTKSIEFYGNSITVGYSVDDTVGDSGAPEFCNNYYSYASITARHYKANYTCIAKSGIGLMVSWFPLIMPEMYDRLEEADTLTKWDFTHNIPDVVVIDLGQNDSWLVLKPQHAQYLNRFGSTPPDEAYIINAYKHFIQSIRKKYPTASIVCTLGSMDATKEGSLWPGYITKAVQAVNDKKIYIHFFPYIHTNKHPKRKEQMAMADDLIRFIDKASLGPSEGGE